MKMGSAVMLSTKPARALSPSCFKSEMDPWFLHVNPITMVFVNHVIISCLITLI